jgi:selenocysteine-specific elongation factor
VESERRAATALIADAGTSALPIESLVWRVGIDPRDLEARVAVLVADGTATRAGDVLVAADVLNRLKEGILAALGEHHRANPLSDGVPREELRAQRFRRGHQAVFDRALIDLAERGLISLRDRVSLASHRLELSPDEARARDAIDRAFRDAGLTPPDLAALPTAVGAPGAVVDRIVKLLQRQKVLVRVDTLLFHDEALKRLQADVKALKTSAAGTARIDVAAFKERFGVTRKFAIPLLEYLDRERVTRRAGDARVVL